MLTPRDTGNPSTLPMVLLCVTVSQQTLIKSPYYLLGSKAQEL